MEIGDKSAQLKERLGPEKFLAISDLRRSFWTGGLAGTCLGLSLGLSYNFFSIQRNPLSIIAKIPTKSQSRVALGNMLLAGALGGYLGTQMAGIKGLSSLWSRLFWLKEKESKSP